MEDSGTYLNAVPSTSYEPHSGYSGCSLATPEDSGTDDSIAAIPSISEVIDDISNSAGLAINSIETPTPKKSVTSPIENNSISVSLDSNKRIVTRKSSRHSPKSEEKRRKYKVRTRVIKYTLFILNFLSWIVAVVAIGISYYILSETKKVVTDAVDFILDPAIILCVVASITFMMALFGCLGAIRENKYLLRVFYIMLTLMLVIELSIGVLIWLFFSAPVSTEKLMETPKKLLTQALFRYKDDKDLRIWIDLIQYEFKCCGVSYSEDGYKDWQKNIYFNCSRSNPSSERCAVPMSCCIFKDGELKNTMCGFDTTNKEKNDVSDRIHTQGCLKGFRIWLRKNEILITILGALFIAPQIAVVLLARTQVKFMRYKRIVVPPPASL